MAWEQAAKKKREAVFSLIPEDWRIKNPPSPQDQTNVTGKYIHQFLSESEIEITETDAVGIAARTGSGQWKAVDVTKAFCHRAALAHQLTNCLLEIFFKEALDRAQQLDEYFATHKKPMGPLHGLPVSLKDQFHVKGVETTMGYVGWIDTFQGKKGTGLEKNFESELVKELRDVGAVFYCKTSVPHTLMYIESENNIMGNTLNPKNRLLSAGGSSGGEGALVGLKGSPLGFGSDIGGSIRIPSSSNGLFGLRPSTGRVPYEGAANSMDGQNTILSTLGPLTNSASSLKLALQAVLSRKPWLHDPMVVELPWRFENEVEIQKLLNTTGDGGKMAFGLVRRQSDVSPHPPVKRALETLAMVLQKLGHEIVEWDPQPSHHYLQMLAFRGWTMDGGADVYGSFDLSGEPHIPGIEILYGKGPTEQLSASEICKLNVEKRDAQKKYMEYWNSTASKTSTGRPVDAIIAHVAPDAAHNPNKHVVFPECGWVNTLDYTSVVVPVITADRAIDVPNVTTEEKEDRKFQEIYDPELYHGLTACVQLVGRRYQEEKMIAIASYVEKALADNL